MRTFIADIIPKIQRFSQQLDNITLLTNQHWVVIDGIQEGKSVYIFRINGELIISTNGRVEKAKTSTSLCTNYRVFIHQNG